MGYPCLMFSSNRYTEANCLWYRRWYVAILTNSHWGPFSSKVIQIDRYHEILWQWVPQLKWAGCKTSTSFYQSWISYHLTALRLQYYERMEKASLYFGYTAGNFKRLYHASLYSSFFLNSPKCFSLSSQGSWSSSFNIFIANFCILSRSIMSHLDVVISTARKPSWTAAGNLIPFPQTNSPNHSCSSKTWTWVQMCARDIHPRQTW